MKNELNHVLNGVKNVDTEIHKILIPILKDTISDTNMHNKRLFILIVGLLFTLLVTVIFSISIVYQQTIKYHEFLNEFDFETEIYQETDNNSTINSGINVNK